MSSRRTAVAVSVRAVEKRYQPVRCYKFVLEVQWSDHSRYVIYRSYSEFMELHLILTSAFPIEAGEIDANDRVLPKLEGLSIFSRGEVQKVAERRRGEISDYCNRLMTLQPRISQHPKLLDFLELRDDDLNVPSDSRMKKSSAFKSIGNKLKKKRKRKGKKQNDFEGMNFDITNPLQLETYAAAIDYKAVGKGQINLKKGDNVDVIDKNQNGWWYVSCNGLEGWAPATFLDKLSSNARDEVPCLAGEMFLTVKAYKGEHDDELSFDSHVVVEVLNKVLDGWWIANYNEKVGYVPSTYLKAYTNPYLSSSTPPKEPEVSPVLPTPRRKSVYPGSNDLPKARDLQPYRRATEKRRQRTVRHKKTAEHENEMPDLSSALSCIIERESAYLEPSKISDSSNSSNYVDSDQRPELPKPAPRTPDMKKKDKILSKNVPATFPRNSSVSMINQHAQYESNATDYGYEPVSSYKGNNAVIPAYRAPDAPLSPPTVVSRTSIIDPTARYSMDSDYEPISATRASTLPPVLNVPKINMKPKIPPPKPSSNLLTRMMTADDDYSYTPVFTIENSNQTAPAPSPAQKVTPPPRSPNINRSGGSPAPPKAPRGVQQSNGDLSPLSEVIANKMNNLSHVSSGQVCEVERNNNDSDGKIYEEWLVKPSQLKGLKTAQVRSPK